MPRQADPRLAELVAARRPWPEVARAIGAPSREAARMRALRAGLIAGRHLPPGGRGHARRWTAERIAQAEAHFARTRCWEAVGAAMGVRPDAVRIAVLRARRARG